MFINFIVKDISLTFNIPRPGLKKFLEVISDNAGRIVIMTTVPEDRFRKIAQHLVDQRVAPEWFVLVEYINWQRPYKDLLQIPDVNTPTEVLLVDDYEGYVRPDQKDRWIKIETFFDQGEKDRELLRVMEILKAGN